MARSARFSAATRPSETPLRSQIVSAFMVIEPPSPAATSAKVLSALPPKTLMVGAVSVTSPEDPELPRRTQRPPVLSPWIRIL